eukprot:TRINITY_DN17947_c0_g1_i4.p1 TRINITY_DN17947_c0_g1~~TRINITY_DN17947_c0_g1_i4.p1  ORF type:complete len:187 (-),score=26.69 TRINITY_DN17947_c0_g1_i4:316-876(-)
MQPTENTPKTSCPQDGDLAGRYISILYQQATAKRPPGQPAASSSTAGPPQTGADTTATYQSGVKGQGPEGRGDLQAPDPGSAVEKRSASQQAAQPKAAGFKSQRTISTFELEMSFDEIEAMALDEDDGEDPAPLQSDERQNAHAAQQNPVSPRQLSVSSALHDRLWTIQEGLNEHLTGTMQEGLEE